MSSRGKKIRYEGDMGLFGDNNRVNPEAWSMQDSQIIAPRIGTSSLSALSFL
jgi:hypothetical protein